MSTRYVPFDQLNKHIKDWEKYAPHTAGEVWDLEPDHATFWNLVREVAMISEGEYLWLYRDYKGWPTTGVGYLITKETDSAGNVTGGARDRAITALLGFEWTLGGRKATRDEVIREFDSFMSETLSLKAKNWNVTAKAQERYSKMRLVDNVSVFQKKATGKLPDKGLNYWGGVTRRHPDWKDKPMFAILAVFYSTWMAGPGEMKKLPRPAAFVESLAKNHFRDHEEVVAKFHAQANNKGNMNSASVWNFRDMDQAAAKYFCVEKCNGMCDLAAQCTYKENGAKGPRQGARKPQPLTVIQPRMETRESNSTFDEWLIELRVWDPFNRSGCYDASGQREGNNGGTLYALRGDGHADFGDLSEAKDQARHRALLTAKFRYHYLRKDGKLVGQYISAEELDPGFSSQLRTASVQKLDVFGPNVRYRSDDQGQTWSLDKDAKFPANDAVGTRVLWPPRAQNFESFTLQIVAENPTAPKVAPPLNATLRGRFEGDKLKLTLECAKWPSVGVRVRRTRDGSEQDMLPGYQKALVDAHAEYDTWLKAQGLPAAVPGAAWNRPGAADAEMLRFETTFAGQRFTWNQDVDWVNGPQAEQPTEEQPAPTPAPTVRTGSKKLKELYDSSDKSEIYDALKSVWESAQVEAGRAYGINNRRGFDFDTTPTHINLLGVRACPLGTLKPGKVTFDRNPAAMAYDDTLFVIWQDAAKTKHVEAFIYDTEPTCYTQSARIVSWMATGQHEYAIGIHHKSSLYRALPDVEKLGFSYTTSAGKKATCGYRALNPVGIGALCWPSSGTPLKPNTSARPKNDAAVNLHWGGDKESTPLKPYGKGAWSEGCQVIAHRERYFALWRLIEADTSIMFAPAAVSAKRNKPELVSSSGGAHNRTIKYTLVNGDLLLKLGYS